MNNLFSITQAHLLVGEENQLYKTIIQYLQQIFCLKQQDQPNSNCSCTECKKLKNNQHPSIVWIKPEKKYVIDDIKVVFEKIQFKLEQNQKFFFILNETHNLSSACANKLLKTLEEPPTGYTFFLLTNNEHSIIKTILSRCQVHHFNIETSTISTHPLVNFFNNKEKFSDPIGFVQELRKQKPSETESIDLMNQLISSVQKQIIDYHKNCLTLQDLKTIKQDSKYNYLEEVKIFLQNQLLKPPQPGSAMLFWKNLFIAFPRYEQITR